MDDPSRADIIGEVVAAARRLICFAADLPSAKMEQQERSHASMADESDVVAVVGCERCLNFAHNTTLRIDSSLPSADAFMRAREKSVSDRLEF